MNIAHPKWVHYVPLVINSNKSDAWFTKWKQMHCVILSNYNDVIMSSMASQTSNLTIVYSTVCLVKSQIKENIKAPRHCPDSKVHGANLGPTWVLWVPDGPHVGPMDFVIRVAFVRGIHLRPANSRHKGPVKRKMFPFDDIIRVIL